MKRPTIAWHCTKRWTAADDQKLRSQLALLRQDIDQAGGPNGWIHNRLEPWLAQAEPRCEHPMIRLRKPSRVPAH
jgi:hypothetical protein